MQTGDQLDLGGDDVLKKCDGDHNIGLFL